MTQSITTKQKKLGKFVSLVREMRLAQIDYEDNRDYGSLVWRPLERKSKELEQQVDKYLEDSEKENWGADSPKS